MVYVIPHLVEFFRATLTPGLVQVFFVGFILISFCIVQKGDCRFRGRPSRRWSPLPMQPR